MKTSHVIDIFSKTDTDYGFAVGKVRVLETRLLDKPFLEGLLESVNLETAINKLQQTDYMGFLKEPSKWERGLESHYNYILEMFAQIVPEPELIRLFRLRYDFHNIKILLRQKLIGQAEPLSTASELGKLEGLIDLGTISLKVLQDTISKERYSLLPPHIARVILDTWQKVSKDKDPQLITILLDRWLYHTLFREAEKLSLFLERFFSTWIDLYNIKTFFRAKKLEMGKEFFDNYFLHHGTIDRYQFERFYEDSVPDIVERLVTSRYFEVVEVLLSTWALDRSLLRIDKAVDDFITKILRPARLMAFGIEPIVSYIWAKDMELKNIRLILTAIQFGLDKSWIRQHIREI